MKGHLYTWGPLAAWAGLIFAVSSLPQSLLIRTSESIERTTPLSLLTEPALVHAVEFGVLAVLTYRAIIIYRALAAPYLWTVVMVAVVAYGVLDELHQSFVPGRFVSLEDMGFNSLGALIGVAVVEAAVRLRRRA